MKTLQHILESLLDMDFDVTDQDINTLEEFLKKYKRGRKIMKSAPYDEFVRACAGCPKITQLPEAEAALRAGKSTLTIAERPQGGIIFCLLTSDKKYAYAYNSLDLAMSWERPRRLSWKSLESYDGGIFGSNDKHSLYRKCKRMEHFILEPWQSQKFFEVLG